LVRGACYRFVSRRRRLAASASASTGGKALTAYEDERAGGSTEVSRGSGSGFEEGGKKRRPNIYAWRAPVWDGNCGKVARIAGEAMKAICDRDLRTLDRIPPSGKMQK
jgi:hypothetical protein